MHPERRGSRVGEPTHSWTVLSRLSPRLAPALAERADHWSAGPRLPVEPRLSASVVLLRDGRSGGRSEMQTYLLHRHARMRFAAGMVVFPGGGVDPVDGVGPGAVVRCALRETKEETGVELAAGGLRRWAHWVTPELEPRRYDTTFFVAALPDGQDATDISGETVTAAWATPHATLSAAAAGELALMPPTLSILLELADCGDVAEVLHAAAGRVVQTVLPELVRAADGWRFRYPTVGETR